MKSLLQRVYPYFPVPLQNAGISAYGWLYKRERLSGVFQATVAEFEERDRWDQERMRDHTTSVLRSTLRCAFEAPFYRDRWERAGIAGRHLDDITSEKLCRLPLVSKEELRTNPYAFIPEQDARRRGLLSYFSSGSTGTPVRAICTRKGQQRFAAAREARSYRWAGTSILQPRAMIGGQPILSRVSDGPPYHRYNYAERQVYFSAYHMSPSSVGSYVDAFNRHRPRCVTGYAFSQFMMARLMLDQGLSFAFVPEAAITSSEPLTDSMRETIQRAWGCRAYQEYGSVENCGLATECEAGSLHVSSDFGVIEIVDNDGFPVGPGVEGRIVCTGLLNDVQFLVRYDIGDVGIWAKEPCPCGRAHLPVLERLTGRVEDAVVGPGGLELVRFHSVFINLPHVQQGQVVQEALDRFRVRVVVDEGFGPAGEAEIRRRMVARLGDVIVAVERTHELERNSRGKVRAVVNRLPPRRNNDTRAF